MLERSQPILMRDGGSEQPSGGSSDPVQEVELKLELAGAAADEIGRSDLLPGTPVIVQQRSIYYDTPKFTLRKRGLSLRLRRANGCTTQTVKATGPGAAGLFARSEWEQPALTDTPVLDDGNPVRAALGKKANKLAPRFEVDVERRTWMLVEGEAQIEVVLDRGMARSAQCVADVCEIELELKAGAVASLLDASTRLFAAAPMRVGVLTKAERGHLLCQPPHPAFKAEAVIFAKSATAAEAFQAIVQNCLRQFRLNEDLVLDTGAAEPLHQARVAVRRLRSALSMYRRMIADDPRVGEIAGELRWLAGELGQARDLDVLLGRLAPGALHARVHAEQISAYRRVRQVLDSPRSRGLMLDLVAWLHDGQWLRAAGGEALRREDAGSFAATALRKLRRRILRAGSSLAGADDEVRHEVRKNAKKLRYASEFFESLFVDKKQARRRKRFGEALEDLQDRLGTLNDLATAPSLLAGLGLMKDPEAAALVVPRDKDAMIQAAVAAQGALIKVKPFWRSR